MKVLYGIKNCDSVKKARVWLDARQIVYSFHDFRTDGVDRAFLDRLLVQYDLAEVLNRRSTSWRDLSEADKCDLSDAKAFQLMQDVPTLIKRPIFDNGVKLIVGFHPELYL